MALDYLSSPGMFLITLPFVYPNESFLATSVDVERVFSRGRLILSHVRSRLNAESTRALLCLGNWSLRGQIKDEDIGPVSMMPDVQKGAEEVLEENWDKIM